MQSKNERRDADTSRKARRKEGRKGMQKKKKRENS
jgi:hypothetical protein